MKHGITSTERLRAIGGPLMGLIVVQDLIRRAMVAAGAEPGDVEYGLMGPPPETLDALSEDVRPMGGDGPRVRDRLLWDPLTKRRGTYARTFESIARQVLGRAINERMATRRDLWRIAVHLVAEIDQAPRREAHEHYPMGWREAYALVKHHGRAQVGTEAPEAAPEPDPAAARHSVLAAVDYVAERLGCSMDDVLERVGRDRQTIGPEDEKAVLALLGARVGR